MKKKTWAVLLGLGCFGMVLLVAGGAIGLVWWLGDYKEDIMAEARLVPPPDMSGYALYSPKFETKLGTIYAGHAFLAKDIDTGSVYLLTAHHLLGTAGGLSRDLAWDEVADMVVSVECRPMVPGLEPLTLTEVIPIEGAKGMDDVTGADDILVFKAPDALADLAIPLRKRPVIDYPKEAIWLYSGVMGSEEKLHLAVVEDSNSQWLNYLYDGDIELQATSGAPVVDKNGHLVAINLGGYEFGGVNGLGNPIRSIRKQLAKIAPSAVD